MHRQRKKQKLLPRILVGVNLFVILLLLCGSSLLIAFSLSGESALLGYRALLEAPSREGGIPESDRFLLYRPLGDTLPQVGDRILLQSDAGELTLVGVLQTEGTSLVCETDAGRSIECTVSSPECLGKVVVESGALGHFFARIGNPKTLPLTILVIFAAALFVCVCLLFASIFSARKRQRASSAKDPAPADSSSLADDLLPTEEEPSSLPAETPETEAENNPSPAETEAADEQPLL